jgi:hypothetical protein
MSDPTVKPQPDDFDVEAAYDEHIHPLMAQIIALCKEHGIPMLASFQLTGKQAESAEMMCSTALVPEWACDGLQRLARELRRIRAEQRGVFAAIAVYRGES